MKLKTLSSNIKFYRLRAKKSQTKIAQAAGVNRSAYIMIENGISEPRSGTLLKISQALGVSLSSLFEEPINISGIRFRSNKIRNKSDDNTRSSDIRNFMHWFNSYTFLQNLLPDKKQIKLIDNQINKINLNNSPIEIANAARSNFNLNDTEPLNDIIKKLESIGIKIYLRKLYLKNCFGFSVSDDYFGKAIAINIDESISIERQIFTAAHELGHLILHQGSFNIEDKKELKIQEDEANIFASYFLMPDRGFRNKLTEYAGLNPIDIILKIKLIFKVSYKTVLKRLIDDKIVDYSIYKKFAIHYKQIYGRDLRDHFEPECLREKKSDYSPNNEPETLSALELFDDGLKTKVFEAYSKELISISRAAEILEIPLSEMKELINNWTLLKYDNIVK